MERTALHGAAGAAFAVTSPCGSQLRLDTAWLGDRLREKPGPLSHLLCQTVTSTHKIIKIKKIKTHEFT